MKVESLREFLHLAEVLNFSATARHFFISQSSLSKHIFELEKELAAPLFTRSKHSVQLTDAGEVFVPEARKVVAAHDDAIAAMQKALRSSNSVLNVAYLRGACQKYMPLALRLFAKCEPGTVVNTRSAEMDEMLELLGEGRIDLAMGMTIDRESETLNIKPLYEDAFTIMVPRGHALAGAQSIKAAEIGEPVFVPANFPKSRVMNAFIIDRLTEAGIENQPFDRVNDIDSYTFVSHVQNIACISCGHLGDIYEPHLKQVRLEDVDLQFDIACMWKKSNRKRALDEFVECMDQAVEAMGR